MRVEFDSARIDAVLARFNQCTFPGVAVGVALHGKPVYRRAFGLANMELPVTLAPTMRMRIGSTTKHFTALAYLLLCEEGRASIEDPIGKYLPELHPVTHAVTVRQLLCNVGGLRDVCDIVLRFSGAGKRVSTDDSLSLYRALADVNAAPGTNWIYNNSGYVMVSAAIERITGEPLEEVLRGRIFEPVGMNDTLLRRYDTDFVPNSATLHMINPQGDYEKSYFGIDFAGAGAMVSTIDDMLRWCLHMESPHVGTSTTWDALQTPYVLANGASTGYGMGLILGAHRGFATLSHPGGGMGGNAQMLRLPELRLDVVVIVNRHDVQSMQVASDVLDACLPRAEAFEPKPVQPITGTFRSPHSGRTIQLSELGGEQIVSLDGFELPYRPMSDATWSPAPLWRFIKRHLTMVGPRDAPQGIRLDDFGNGDDFERVGPRAPSEPAAWEGRYVSTSTGSAAAIHQCENRWQLRCTGRFGTTDYNLEPVGAGIWRARPAAAMNLGGVVTVAEGVPGFKFFSYGNRDIHFEPSS